MDLKIKLEKELHAKIAIEWLTAGIRISSAVHYNYDIGKNRTLAMMIFNQILLEAWERLDVFDIVIEDGPIYGLK